MQMFEIHSVATCCHIILPSFIKIRRNLKGKKQLD